MAMAVVVSEFLFFLFNKFGKTPETNLKSLLVDFYEESEIMMAKEVLHAELEKINCTGLSRLVRRQVINAGWMLMTSCR